VLAEYMAEDTIQKLEQRISDMIELCERMSRENELLKTDQQMLRQEFATLQEKNKIARGRVEQIVARLKSLES
jgi:cell division protein ZapB